LINIKREHDPMNRVGIIYINGVRPTVSHKGVTDEVWWGSTFVGAVSFVCTDNRFEVRTHRRDVGSHGLVRSKLGDTRGGLESAVDRVHFTKDEGELLGGGDLSSHWGVMETGDGLGLGKGDDFDGSGHGV
jgi:hypothetical protein